MNPQKKKETLRFIKFLLFSASAGLIEFGSFSLLSACTPWPYWPCYLIALTLSVLWNFTFNRRFTFQSAANVPVAMLKVLAYYAVFTPLSTWWGDALTRCGWNDFLVLAGTMLINFATEFLFQRFVVYRNRIDTNDVARRAQEKAGRPEA